MIKRITDQLFIYLILSLLTLTSSFKLKPIHWYRHMFCRLHVAYILYYKHYQAYLKYLRVGPIDTRPIYFRFNKTESILVIISNPWAVAVGRKWNRLIGGLEILSCVWGWPVSYWVGGLEAIAAYVYTHIMKAATYSVCMYFVYISAFHIHILPNICCIH